jgi:hypothetical protein
MTKVRNGIRLLINDDCSKKVRYFADKLSTKMIEEAVAVVSRESLDCFE